IEGKHEDDDGHDHGGSESDRGGQVSPPPVPSQVALSQGGRFGCYGPFGSACRRGAATGARTSRFAPASVAREHAAGRTYPQPDPHEGCGRTDQVAASFAVGQGGAARGRSQLPPAHALLAATLILLVR